MSLTIFLRMGWEARAFKHKWDLHGKLVRGRGVRTEGTRLEGNSY